MTVRKSARGRWMVDVQIEHTDGRIERVRKVAPVQTKRDAQAYETELRRSILDGTREKEATRREAPTLADFSAEYLKHCETTNRPQYARRKAIIVRTNLLPYFGAMQLERIGRREIESYRNARSRDVAAKTVNNEVGILRHMLSTALEYELVSKTPKIRPLKAPLPEIGFLGRDEQQRLLAAARRESGPWATMIIAALRTGLRLGELRGLRWKDVDLVAGRVFVRQAADDRNAITPPKSGKAREVPLGNEVAVELRGHKHLRGPLVFCDDDGSILGASRCRDAMDRIMRRAELATGDGQWHLLRHTFASELVMRGATLKAVQELLGHSSLAMVLRYAHLSPDVRRDAVRLLDSQRHHGGTAEGGRS